MKIQKFQRIMAAVLAVVAVAVVSFAIFPTTQSNDNDVIEVTMETTPVGDKYYSMGDLRMHQAVLRSIEETVLAKKLRVEEGDTKGEKDPEKEQPSESVEVPKLFEKPAPVDEEALATLAAVIHGEAAGRNDKAEKQIVAYNSLIRMGVEPERAYLLVYVFTEEVRDMMAQTIYGEANYDWLTPAQKSMVIWAILNRYDSGEGWFSDNYYDFYHIIAKPGQFDGYDPSFPIIEEYRNLVDDVIERYIAEKMGEIDVGRTLPNDICFFHADEAGHYNVFYKMSNGWLSGYQIDFGITPLCDPYAEATA